MKLRFLILISLSSLLSAQTRITGPTLIQSTGGGGTAYPGCVSNGGNGISCTGVISSTAGLAGYGIYSLDEGNGFIQEFPVVSGFVTISSGTLMCGTGVAACTTSSTDFIGVLAGQSKDNGGTNTNYIGILGIAYPTFDGAANVGDYATISTTVNGQAHASSTAPSSGLIGRVLQANGGAGTWSAMRIVSGGSTAVAGVTVGYVIGSGAPGTSIGPLLIAPHSGTLSRCIVATKASDAAVDFSFQILRNGTAIFTSAPTITHGSAFGTKTVFTTLVGGSLSVAQDDIFSLNILTGTSSWQVTIQVE